jgi:hypothetical protein
VEGIVDADHAGECDAGMLGQGLDLEWADVRSVMNNDLFATEEPQVAVVVGVDEIAGIEPSAVSFGGCDRVLPVPIISTAT